MIKYVYDNFLKINMVLSLAYIIHKKNQNYVEKKFRNIYKKRGLNFDLTLFFYILSRFSTYANFYKYKNGTYIFIKSTLIYYVLTNYCL